MGMYTELHYNVALKADTPKEIIEVLRFMLGELDAEPKSPTHALFETTRWPMMLCCDSYYFNADTHSTLRYDDVAEHYYLCVRTNLKNYNSEIQKFLQWIEEYVDAYEGDFLGFWRYEEEDTPTLIYYTAKETNQC